MKFIKNIMKLLKTTSLYIVTLLIIVGFGAIIYILKIKGVLSNHDFINNITIFMGWIVALLIAWIYLQKTRKDNQIVKKYEIKKSLEIDAFREINKAVTNFSSKITDIANQYLILPIKLKMHIENPEIFKFNKIEIDMELNKQIEELYRGSADFILTIESNEIAVIEFDHLRKYIQFQVEDGIQLIRDFLRYFNETEKSKLMIKKGNIEFEDNCGKIHNELINIQSYLYDYRIELMNSMLTEIFDKQIPERKPKDPRYKTLKELAIKEEVKKEEEEREFKALKIIS